MAERTLTMRILDSAALQQALARAGFSIARAFDESGQEVEPQARLAPRTPCAPTRIERPARLDILATAGHPPAPPGPPP